MTNAEIQVGEYVRTKEDYIAKCVNKSGYALTFDNTVRTSYGEPWDYLFPENNEIVNHSFNLIDLIEVGDYVNGVKIGKEELFDNGLRIISEDIGDCYYETTFRSDKPEEVKTIVTKEQFKSMEYKVGGEDD